MSRRLSVAVGRESPGSIEAPDTFETGGSFGVDLDNHGRDVRVHVALEDDLAAVATVPENNYRVERGASLTVPVDVSADGSRSGTLTVATGYGREDHEVSVTVDPTDAEEMPVDPAPTGETGSDAGRGTLFDIVAAAFDGHRDRPVGLLAMAGVAVIVALVASTAVGGIAGFAGGLVVLLGVAVAGWLLLVEE